MAKIHMAHHRGGDSTLYDAKCGVWWPKHVTTFIQDVTCKSCLRVWGSEQQNISEVRRAVVHHPNLQQISKEKK